MYKYFDNIIYFLQKSGGGSVYWGEITKRFVNDPDSFFIQPALTSENIVYRQLEFKNTIREKKFPLKILRYTPLTVPVNPDSIFHSSYYRYCGQKGVKNVVTVHDFTHEHFAKGLPRFVHHTQKGIAVKKAAGIICISEKTKNDLYAFYPEYVKGKKVEVIYNGVSDDFYLINDISAKQNRRLPEDKFKCVLYIGHRTNYKNFNFTVEVIKNLPNEYKLLIVGNELTNEENIFLEKNIKGKYIFLGNLTNHELNEIYNISECLLYPSSYEGFGIPVIEAFKCGCPVIAQKIPVIEEISAEAALLVEDLSIKKFINAISELKNVNFKSGLIKAGIKQAEKYSWFKCSTEVNKFYETI